MRSAVIGILFGWVGGNVMYWSKILFFVRRLYCDMCNEDLWGYEMERTGMNFGAFLGSWKKKNFM